MEQDAGVSEQFHEHTRINVYLKRMICMVLEKDLTSAIAATAQSHPQFERAMYASCTRIRYRV